MEAKEEQQPGVDQGNKSLQQSLAVSKQAWQDHSEVANSSSANVMALGAPTVAFGQKSKFASLLCRHVFRSASTPRTFGFPSTLPDFLWQTLRARAQSRFIVSLFPDMRVNHSAMRGSQAEENHLQRR